MDDIKLVATFIAYNLNQKCGFANNTCTRQLALHVSQFHIVVCDNSAPFNFPRPSYWSVTLDNNKCLIPLNYREANVTQCVLRFSVCDPLPSAQCPGRTNSSTCQEVTTDDGQKHYFDIGTYRGNGGYAPLGICCKLNNYCPLLIIISVC